MTSIKLNIPPDRTLKPFQVDGCQKLLQFLTTNATRAAYLADDCGLGKSVQALVVANMLNSHPVLIVCPKIMRLAWKRFIQEWAVMDADCIHVMTYDSVWRPAYRCEIPEHIGLLICDEFHFCKTPSTKRAKAVLGEIWKRSTYRLALSATPMTTSVLDLYPACRKMAPHVLRFKNKAIFADTFAYAEETKWGTKYFGLKNQELLSKTLRENFLVRRTKTEVLPELPERMFQEIILEGQYGQWNSESDTCLKKELDTYIKTGRLPRDERAENFRLINSMTKVPAIVEFAKQLLDQKIPIVIFAYHRRIITALNEYLSDYKVRTITGSTLQSARQDYIDNFQKENLECLILQINAASTGITLTRASHVLFAEITYSPADIEQAVSRCHRIGTQSNVNAYYFTVDGNKIDAAMIRTVIGKAETFKKVLASEF